LTVGVPEINLDTWGLRYVKKKNGKSEYDKLDTSESVFAGGTALGDKPSTNTKKPTAHPTSTTSGLSPSGSPSNLSVSDLDLATADPSGRQNDSSGDTTGRYSSGGKKVGEQTHEHPAGDPSQFQLKEPAKPTHGTKRGEGATHGVDTHATRQFSEPSGQALTAGTKKKPVTTSAGLEGSKQTHTGSKGYNYATDPPKSRGGHTLIPAKQGEGSSAKPSKYIQRASLDLSIIKCKLLKMKTKKHDFIEENKPTRPAYRKDDDDDDKKEDKEKSDRCVSCGQKTRTEKTPNQTPEGEAKIDTKERHDDVVEKAIELINEAYDEMKSSSFKKLKPVYEGDTKEAKKAKEAKKEGAMTDEDWEAEAKVSFGKDPKTGKAKKPEPLPEGFPYHKEDKKEAKKEGDGGSATTSDVGVANFVYSDVEEKKKQDEGEDNKYQQGKNTMYNSPHSEAGIQDKEITPHPNPAKGKHTKDTKYFSQTGEELGRGKEGRKLQEADSKTD